MDAVNEKGEVPHSHAWRLADTKVLRNIQDRRKIDVECIYVCECGKAEERKYNNYDLQR